MRLSAYLIGFIMSGILLIGDLSLHQDMKGRSDESPREFKSNQEMLQEYEKQRQDLIDSVARECAMIREEHKPAFCRNYQK